MPNGATHYKLWRAGVVPMAIGCVVYALGDARWYTALAIWLGYMMGWAIDPDMDMRQNTRSKKIWRSHWFLLPLYPWWLVYSWVATNILGGHRSLLTHLPLLSTGLRMIWLFLPISMVAAIVGSTSSLSMNTLGKTELEYGTASMVWIVLRSLVIGLSISDTIHFVADLIRRDN